jgi:hypothetical protein
VTIDKHCSISEQVHVLVVSPDVLGQRNYFPRISGYSLRRKFDDAGAIVG